MATNTNDGRNEPLRPAPIDKAEVYILVDNVSDLLSSVPPSVKPEVLNLLEAGAEEISGTCLCCAHWGLSLVITAERDGVGHTVLFDSGPEAYAVERNGDRLGIDFGGIEAVVLSHGHWDHAGGMLAALDHILAANGGRPVPVHVNPDMFVSRATKNLSERIIPFENIPSVDELTGHGAEVVNDGRVRLLLDDMFYLSGEIPRVTPYEKGLPGHMKRTADDRDWEPDPLIMDERFLAVDVEDKGVIVFTACSHAGVVNVLTHAREMFAPTPIFGVMGGFHLSGKKCEAIIPETVADLKQFNLSLIVPGHCTGWRATHALLNTFGEEVVVPSAVGRFHEI